MKGLVIAKEKLTLIRRQLQEIIALLSKITTLLRGILINKDDHLFSPFGIILVRGFYLSILSFIIFIEDLLY